MKKTTAIIGAFMLVALFGANSFAQNASHREILSIGNGALKKGLTAGLEKIKQEHEKDYIAKANQGYIVKANLKDFLLDETFTAKSSGENFRVLLPKSLTNTQIKKQFIKLEKGEIDISGEFPYMEVTVLQNNNIQPIKIKATISSKEDDAAEYSLRLTYSTNNTSHAYKIATIQPVSFIVSANSAQIKLGETTKIVNIEEHHNVVLPEGYKPVAKEWKGHNYFGFIIDPNPITFSLNQKKGNTLFLTFINENPKENVPVTIIENEEAGKVYCKYFVGGKTYQDLIAVKK